jgi:hypothetical protein
MFVFFSDGSLSSSKLHSWALEHNGRVCFFLWRELPFQLNTFTAVIKQKYIEANDLVSLTLELFHPLKYDTPRFFLSKCGNIIKVITRKYGIASRLPI